MAQPIYFQTGPSPVFLRITCVTPGASAFFTSSVTSVVKKQRKPVKSHPTALTVTSAVLISHKATEKTWHTMCHNIQTHTTIHLPVFLDNSHLCSVFVCLQCFSAGFVSADCTQALPLSFQTHANYLLSLQMTVGFTAVIYDLWANVYTYLYAINIGGTRLSPT